MTNFMTKLSMLHSYTTEAPNSSSTLLHQYVQHKEYTRATTLTLKETLKIVKIHLLLSKNKRKSIWNCHGHSVEPSAIKGSYATKIFETNHFKKKTQKLNTISDKKEKKKKKKINPMILNPKTDQPTLLIQQLHSTIAKTDHLNCFKRSINGDQG